MLHQGELNIGELCDVNTFKNHDFDYDKIGGNWNALNGDQTEVQKVLYQDDTSVD